MKGIRLLIAVVLGGAVAMAMAAEKPPTWLVGSFKGHDNYLSADWEMTIAGNGQITTTIYEKDGKLAHENGRFHMKRLYIGKRIYDVKQASGGIEVTNIWRMPDRFTLRRL
jgi:hypothetical protein